VNHAALLKLIGELTAQRDDYIAWQAQALAVVGRLVSGQPEVKPGAMALDVLEAYVARLVQERDALRAALGIHMEAKRGRDALAVLNGEPFECLPESASN
jgi:hypothetical protein